MAVRRQGGAPCARPWPSSSSGFGISSWSKSAPMWLSIPGSNYRFLVESIWVNYQLSLHIPIDWHMKDFEILVVWECLRLQDLRCLLGHFRGSHVSKYIPRSSYTGSAGGKPALLPQGALHSSFKTIMKQLNIQKGLDSDCRQKYMYILYIM